MTKKEKKKIWDERLLTPEERLIFERKRKLHNKKLKEYRESGPTRRNEMDAARAARVVAKLLRGRGK